MLQCYNVSTLRCTSKFYQLYYKLASLYHNSRDHATETREKMTWAITRVVLRAAPCVPTLAKWTQLGSALDFHLLGFVHSLFEILFDAAYLKMTQLTKCWNARGVVSGHISQSQILCCSWNLIQYVTVCMQHATTCRNSAKKSCCSLLEMCFQVLRSELQLTHQLGITIHSLGIMIG